MATIGGPTNVRTGTSPITRIDQLAKNAVSWGAASVSQKCDAVFNAFMQVFREQRWTYSSPSGISASEFSYLSLNKTPSAAVDRYCTGRLNIRFQCSTLIRLESRLPRKFRVVHSIAGARLSRRASRLSRRRGASKRLATRLQRLSARGQRRLKFLDRFCHIWSAPHYEDKVREASKGGCGHISGLLVGT